MSYIGNAPISAAFLTDTFSGTGSQTAFTMTVAPANTSSIIVAVTGVLQDPSTYSVSGTTLTFSAAPPSGTSNISVRYLGIPASEVTTTAYRTVTNTTATAGQTSFTIPSYTVGYVDVYRNGVRLVSTDYTATTGTTVVLNNACTVGDAVVTESFYVSSVLNAIPATAGSVGTTYLAAGSVTQSILGTNVAGNGPAFRAYVTGSSYTGFSSSTWTKVALGSETFDTNNNFDSTTNYRFTPTVAGYYQINVAVSTNWTGSQFNNFYVAIYKNGTLYVQFQQNGVSATTNYPTIAGSDLISMNGTSDYLELYVNSTGGSGPAYNQGSSLTWMAGSMVRSA